MNSICQPCEDKAQVKLSPKPLARTALVVEGGGQRGIFTAGVLDSWIHHGFNPFSILIGTSAGAQNLSSYLSCQPGYAKRMITQVTSKPEFFQLKRLLFKQSIVDLDWYFEHLDKSEYNLDTNCALARLDKRQLYFSATRASDKKAVYFHPNADNWLTLLKASSALPFLYKDGVEIAGDWYLDGGLAAPVPIEKALAEEAEKIVVIRTAGPDYEAKTYWLHKLKGFLCKEGSCPKLLDYYTEFENAYEQEQQLIEQHSESIIQLYPQKPLSSSLLGSSREALLEDYINGIESGLAFLKQHKNAF